MGVGTAILKMDSKGSLILPPIIIIIAVVIIVIVIIDMKEMKRLKCQILRGR